MAHNTLETLIDLDGASAGVSCLPTELHRLLVCQDIEEALRRVGEERLVTDVQSLFMHAYPQASEVSKKQFHAALYLLNTNRIMVPWSSRAWNVNHHIFLRLKNLMENLLERFEHALHADVLQTIPTDVEQFGSWILHVVQTHRSNVSHELFSFLRDWATFDQLREFFHQEAPMDLHFADTLLLMMPGMHDDMKMELARNFWDEMGRGNPQKVHRRLRLKQMTYIGIGEHDHLENVPYYCWQELALANLYLQGALDRTKFPQLIGNMLATETMVPGRIDYQLKGWTRVGLSADLLEYLEEHTVVDVKHAEGWLSNLVMPLVRQHPELRHDVAFGALRRLRAAEDICDKMMEVLPTL